MYWEARIIEALQSGGSKAIDYFIYFLTFIGDEIFFIVVAAIIYWCFSKKFAFRFMNVYLFCAGTNQVLKSIIKRPRPFDAYENIRSVFKKSHSWSFPSGHSNSIAVIGTQITIKARKEKKFFRLALITSITATLTVMFSRMYLGQHYLTDVITGAILGISLGILFNFAYNLLEKKAYYFWAIALPLSIILTVILILTGAAQSNYTIIQALAAYAAISLGYVAEKRFVDYDVKSGALWKQIIKITIGLIVAVLILIGGKDLLELFIPAGSVLEVILIYYLLYFLAGLWVMLGAMYVFKKLKI